MSSVLVEVLGRKHTVRVPPMSPLSAVVEAALAAGNVNVDAAACKLMHGRKQMDTSTPLRFANLPSGAKLELITASAHSTDDPLQQLLGRQAHVFSRAAEEASSSSALAPDHEPPDSFYEFTADDYARVGRGWGMNAAGASGSAPLKTAKMRAAEAAAAAEHVGPVPIRIMFPNGMVLQATFRAAEPVSALQDFLERAVAPGATGLHLYTAPPKAVLKQLQASLYESGLAPAAMVYAACSGGDGPVLRPEVLAQQGPPPSRERRPEMHSSKVSPTLASAAAMHAPAAAASERPPEHQARAKPPKWLMTKK